MGLKEVAIQIKTTPGFWNFSAECLSCDYRTQNHGDAYTRGEVVGHLTMNPSHRTRMYHSYSELIEVEEI